MTLDLGTKIAELLKKNNMTQKEFAMKLAITESAMSRYMSNARMPKLNLLRQMAEVLGVTTDELLGKEDKSDFSSELPRITRLLARHSNALTQEQKKEIVNALFS